MILDITLTPAMLMIVVKTIMIMPRMIAFSAKSLLYRFSELAGLPTSWNFVLTWGSTICHARATAGTVITCAHMYIQPVFQAQSRLATCFDHW